MHVDHPRVFVLTCFAALALHVKLHRMRISERQDKRQLQIAALPILHGLHLGGFYLVQRATQGFAGLTRLQACAFTLVHQ